MVPLGLFLFRILSHLAMRYLDETSKLVLRQLHAGQILVAGVHIVLVEGAFLQLVFQKEGIPLVFHGLDVVQIGKLFRRFHIVVIGSFLQEVGMLANQLVVGFDLLLFAFRRQVQ